MSSSRLLYGGAVFLAAFLLFLIEPMAAKQLLPVLGGSSAVWVTCLVFFQLALLLGYLYAHWIARHPSRGWQQRLHIGLLAIAVVALAMPMRLGIPLSGATAHPVTTIFSALSATIGLPFLMLASTSPLLQIWLSRSEKGAIPYRLFALSNVGSLLALALYPTVVEPHMTLRHQRLLWSLGFVAYAVLCAVLARQARSVSQAAQPPQLITRENASPASTWKRSLWFLLPMGAAMQLTAVTSHLSQNIAAIPLLWILPLAAYLLTFVIAFQCPAFYRRGLVVRLLVLMLASLGYALSKTDLTLPIGLSIAFFLAEEFTACYFCHAEVHALRPQRASEATLFYLLIAGGGVAGTFLIAIASPMIFAANYDLALSFFATAILALLVTRNDGWAQRLLWSTGCILMLALLLMLHTVFARESLIEVRNFYGTLRVTQSYLPPEAQGVRTLLNGTIQHGTEWFAPEFLDTPTTYYADDSGVGLALRFCCQGQPRNVGVIGLGVGTLAAYGQHGDRFRFYEINPLVGPIARHLFTYLRNSRAQISFSYGDARASLTREPPQHFNLIVVDAFSGDAIPVHLLTTEAIALYRRHLAPGGILAFHISNQYLDLAPEIAQLARSAGMRARLVISASNEARGEYKASWVLVGNNSEFFALPAIELTSSSIWNVRGVHPWTDDYSSLLPILQWKRH